MGQKLNALYPTGLPSQSYGSVGEILPETAWRGRPESIAKPQQASGLIISRWTGTASHGPLEVSADWEDNHHTISICSRRTDARLLINKHVVWNGATNPNPLLLTGPRSSRWEAIFFGPYDTIRIYIPPSTLADCHSYTFGYSPSTPINLLEVDDPDDTTLRSLGNAIRLVCGRAEYYGPGFLEALGIALASRLLQVYCRPTDRIRQQKEQALSLWRLKLVIDFVESNLASPIGLTDLSQLVGLSKMHFAAQFKAAQGVTPYAYVLQRRIARAQQMLTETDRSVVEIASAVGFGSQPHFTTTFRRIVGDTPMRWREAHTV